MLSCLIKKRQRFLIPKDCDEMKLIWNLIFTTFQWNAVILMSSVVAGSMIKRRLSQNLAYFEANKGNTGHTTFCYVLISNIVV